MNDVAWLLFIGLTSTFVVQLFAIAVAVFADTREDPVFPRWSAYLNIWAALGVAPGCLVVFVDDGPFAWDGLVFWLLVISFLIWIVIMAVLLFRAIKHDESSSSDSAGRPPVEAGT